MGVPQNIQNGWFTVENPIKMDHSWVPHGTPIFRKPPYIHCKLVCTDNTATDVSLICNRRKVRHQIAEKKQ